MNGTAPLTQPLAQCFGTGAPGWLSRDVPPGTSFDFQEGRVGSAVGSFVRVPGATRWARAH